MLRWSRSGGATSTVGRATITLLRLRRSMQVVVRSCAQSLIARNPRPITRQISDRYAPHSNRSVYVRSRLADSDPRRHGSSSRPISFRCESASSEIPRALSPVITIRSSMARDSRPGNSRSLYTVVLANLVAQGVAEGGPSPNTGRVFRRTPTGKLVPYYDRADIEDGALDGRHLEICWLRTAAEALSMEMEGSGRVRLEDGSLLRISYDAHNGYSYVPAGRVLIERHVMPREDT